jgi:hypothetical protein
MEAYVRAAADFMNMRDWTVLVNHSRAERGNYASMHATYGKREMSIWFCKELRSLSREQIRKTVVHELLHAHFQPAWHYLKNVLPVTSGKKATHAIRCAVTQREEEAVDAIAAAIAPALPLIEWPE